MLGLDDAEVALVAMCLDRMLDETERQLDGGYKEGCIAAAWYCTRLCREQIAALRERITKHQNHLSESGDGG